MRHLTAILLALAAIVGALSACSPRPSADALEGPAKDVSSAVRTATLAVDLRIKDNTTAAAGSTAADDMLREVESATDEVEGYAAPTEQERALREDVLAAFSGISRALLHSRDALTAPKSGPEQGQTGSGEAELSTALSELRSATDQLDALMRRAGIQ